MQRRGFFAALAAAVVAPFAAKAIEAKPERDRYTVTGKPIKARIKNNWDDDWYDTPRGTVVFCDGSVSYGPAQDWYCVQTSHAP